MLAPADVVVLDEPFKGLDEAARQAAAAYVRRMQAGRTLLCITHEEGDAALLGAPSLPEAAEQQEGQKGPKPLINGFGPFNVWTTREPLI